MKTYRQETAEHYARIRHDIPYRLCGMMADIEAERQPALFQDHIHDNTEMIALSSTDVAQDTKQYLTNRLNHLQAELNYTRNKLNELLDKGKPKTKKEFKDKGIIPL